MKYQLKKNKINFKKEDIQNRIKEKGLVYEAELLRYRPGIEKDFVERWLQITTDSFRYFENNVRASKFQLGEQVLKDTLEKRSFI